jgi:hypothetical protein
MKKLITRQEYMSNSKELFNEYYLQFATQASYDFINSQIGIKKLITSKCEHLNDLYRHSNSGAGGWIWDNTPINMRLIREAGEGNSQATHTCVGKVVARQMLSSLNK